MPTPRAKIFVVDDDPAIVRGLLALLRGEGYAAQGESTGTAAVAKIKRWRPECVLLDMGLPGLSGIEVCRRLREAGMEAAIIIVSSQGEQADKVLGLEAGADDYVTKPFDTRELLARIRARLRAREGSDSGAGRRTLAAVLFADIAGYSRLMHRSESAALRTLRRSQATVEREVTRARGKIIEVVGDAFLVRFPSAVDALRAALAVQRKLVPRPGAEQGGQVRIGIHAGEVTEFEGGTKGETVNIAARLQAIARPGGIVISEVVRDAVAGKLDVPIRSMGEKKLKNIPRPQKLFAVSVRSNRERE